MKRILALLFIPALVFAAPLSRTLQTNSVCIVPLCGSVSWIPWTNTIPVAAGDLIKSAAGRTYMAVVAGTSTNEPSHAIGDATTLDALRWYAVPQGRQGVVIRSQSAAPVYISLGVPAVNGAGERLLSNEVFRVENYQGAIYAILYVKIQNSLI